MSKEVANTAQRRFLGFGNKYVIALLVCCIIGFSIIFCTISFSEEIKQPNVSGKFYPGNPQELSRVIERFLVEAKPVDIKGEILVLICPHAGYEYSGRTAAYGYKLIKTRQYKSVLILGPSHYVNFKGAALWPKGAFCTPLGKVLIDESLSYNLMLSSSLFSSYPEAFSREHSVEVEIPFLQTVLDDFKIVPVVLGYLSFSDCENLATAISQTIKDKNCLLVASSDMYHGFNYHEGELKDIYTLSLIKQRKPKELYERIQDKKAQLCGWAAVVTSMLVAQKLGFERVEVLDHTNNLKITDRERVGEYCVGYSAIAIYRDFREKGGAMLNQGQRKRLLEIARNSIETRINSGKKLEVSETDPILTEHCGAFVTLHKNNKLRGCIGSLIGKQPLYLTVRDMAIEAAVGDPRFVVLSKEELGEIEIEISVLSPLKKIDNPDKIQLGEHGVLIRSGYRSGVFLPQVATETGWSRIEFLSNLCAHKAGLAPLAWKDPSTEIYIFTAEVFSE